MKQAVSRLTDAASFRRELVSEGTLSVKGAMAFTGLGRRSIEDAVRNGTLPVVRCGRRITIPKRALVQFLADRIDRALPRRS